MLDAITHLEMAAADYRRLTTPNQSTITWSAALENERLANQFQLAAEALRQMQLPIWYHKHWGDGNDIFYRPTDDIPEDSAPLYAAPTPPVSEDKDKIIAAANALENIASTSSSTRIRRVANEALTAIRARRK